MKYPATNGIPNISKAINSNRTQRMGLNSAVCLSSATY